MRTVHWTNLGHPKRIRRRHGGRRRQRERLDRGGQQLPQEGQVLLQRPLRPFQAVQPKTRHRQRHQEQDHGSKLQSLFALQDFVKL